MSPRNYFAFDESCTDASDCSDDNETYGACNARRTYPTAKRIGAQRRQVWDGRATHTKGGLTKGDLKEGPNGRIVSIKASARATQNLSKTNVTLKQWRQAVTGACEEAGLEYTIPQKGTALYKCAKARYARLKRGVDDGHPTLGSCENAFDAAQISGRASARNASSTKKSAASTKSATKKSAASTKPATKKASTKPAASTKSATKKADTPWITAIRKAASDFDMKFTLPRTGTALYIRAKQYLDGQTPPPLLKNGNGARVEEI